MKKVCTRLLFTLLMFSVVTLLSCSGSDSGDEDVQDADSLFDSDDSGQQHSDGDYPDSVENDTDTDADADEISDNNQDSDTPQGTAVSEQTGKLLQQILDEYVSYSYESGISVAVKNGDAPVGVYASGKSNVVTGESIDRNARFRIGSNTKPMTAVVTLRLMEEGLLTLEDRIGDYTDSFPKWDNITIRELLSNSSGIPDYLRKKELLFDALSHKKKVYDVEELLSYVAEDDLIFGENGEGIYSDSNWLLLGMISEQVSGKTFEQLIDEYIVKPLDLQNTFVDVEGGVIENLPQGYLDVYQWDTEDMLSPYLPFFDVIDDRLIEVTYLFHPSVAGSAGAVISTPEDINIFLRSLLNGKLVSEATLEKMMDFGPVIIWPKVVQYGLGLIKRETPEGVLYGHGGLFPGYSSDAYMNLDKDLNVVMMANYFPDQMRSAYGEIFRAVDEALETKRETCLVDETMFTKTYENQLDFRFRGIVRSEETDSDFKDVAYVKITQPRKVYLPYAHARKAVWHTNNDGHRYLEIATSGIHDKDKPNMVKQVLVQIYENELATVSKQNNKISIDQGSDVYAFIVDTELNEERQAGKFCFTGYALTDAASGIAFCHEEGQGYEAGEMLRSWGRFNMEVDEQAVADFFQQKGFDRCFCRTESDEWEACE